MGVGVQRLGGVEEARERLVSRLEQLAPRPGERDPACPAFEERDAELLLQRSHLPRDGWRRHGQLLGRGLEGAVPRGGLEGSQRVQRGKSVGWV